MVEHAVLGEGMHDLRAEAADRAFLDGDEHVVFARQLEHQIGVDRLGETRVGHRRGQAVRLQRVGRLQAFAEPGAEREQGDGRAFAHDATLADFQRNADGGQIDADTVAAREAEGGRTVVDRRRGGDHVHQFGLVGRGHQHEVGQTAEIGKIERAGMGRAVGADQTGAIDDEAHRQTLDRDIVHHLIVGALQEGRVDRDERLDAFGGQTRGEGDRMLLGDADVEGSLRKRLAENVDAGARGHRRGDADDLVILLGFLDQAVAQHAGVGRRVGLRLGLLAGDDIELHDAVVFVGGALGVGIALALLRHDMDQRRADLGIAHVLEHGQQMIEVMAVDRADVIEAEFLEQRAAADHEAARIFLHAFGAIGQYFGQVLAKLLASFAQRTIGLAGIQTRQIGRHGADRRRNRHVVVVEDDDQPRIHRAGIVHRLIGHARRHRAVADHRDDIVLAAGEVARHGHAETGRDRGRGMRCAERIVVALGALGETGQPTAGAQRADAVAAAGEDLVRIGLMADVPDQAVARRVEYVVDRGGQLDDAETGAEVAARH